jgi:hypothetical protein
LLETHFVEIAVKREPKARDALFFQLLVASRQAADTTEERLEALRADVQAGLERLEGYQRWTEMLVQLNRFEAGLERVTYRMTQVGADVQAIFPKLEEIAGLVRGATLAGFTVQGDRLVASSTSVPAMLRERQTRYFARHRLFAGRAAELASIREFLQQRRRGYIFVTGLSGFGKTALLANLVAPEQDRYTWYFLNQLDNTHRHRDFPDSTGFSGKPLTY